MRIVEHSNPLQWVLERLPAAARAAVAGVALSPPGHFSANLSDTGRTAFKKLPLAKRRLAVARVLLHVDQAELACQGLIRAMALHRGDPGIQLRLADALTLLQRRPEALRHYGRVSRLTADPGLCSSALLGSGQALAFDADYGEALRELAEAGSWGNAVNEERRPLELLARIAEREARIYAMTDKEDQAISLYSKTAKLAGTGTLICTSLRLSSEVICTVAEGTIVRR
jgi:tetratricopeptide (TPR) repeat protein